MADYTAVYPSTHDDAHVKATSKQGTNHWAYYNTDPTKSLTGADTGNCWIAVISTVTNQRFHIDLDTAKIVRRIYYENNHVSGGDTTRGVQNFTFWGTNTGAGSFDDLVYANDEGWTQLTIAQSTMDEHVALDQADPKYILVTNSVAYRYYGFKFADNWGEANYMAGRHIALQTEDGYSPSTGFFQLL